jgi:hypothetical protein|nr:MAG TPA: hypothetical protein [Caudoviricetes sp.]
MNELIQQTLQAAKEDLNGISEQQTQERTRYVELIKSRFKDYPLLEAFLLDNYREDLSEVFYQEETKDYLPVLFLAKWVPALVSRLQPYQQTRIQLYANTFIERYPTANDLIIPFFEDLLIFNGIK